MGSDFFWASLAWGSFDNGVQGFAKAFRSGEDGASHESKGWLGRAWIIMISIPSQHEGVL